MADAVNEMNDFAQQNKVAKIEAQMKEATVRDDGGEGENGDGGGDDGPP